MTPIPMLIHCPMCGERHIDEGAFATKVHHTHACQICGHVWRPAIVATSGVAFLPGFKNGSPASTPSPDELAAKREEQLQALQAAEKAISATVGYPGLDALAAVVRYTSDIAAERKSAASLPHVYKQIRDERNRQDRQWGGADHDDTHHPSDWLKFIREHLDRAARAKNDPDAYRIQMVEVAALAVAAIQSLDRREGK